MVVVLVDVVIRLCVAVCSLNGWGGVLTEETTPVTSSMKSDALGGRVLDAGGRIIVVKTSAAPTFTLVIACVWILRVNAFAISTLTAIVMLWPVVTTTGTVPPAIIAVAALPL